MLSFPTYNWIDSVSMYALDIISVFEYLASFVKFAYDLLLVRHRYLVKNVFICIVLSQTDLSVLDRRPNVASAL